MWRLYWEEFLKWLKMEDCECRLDHLNTLLEEFCHEFDDIGWLDKTRIEGRTKRERENFSQNFLF